MKKSKEKLYRKKKKLRDLLQREIQLKIPLKPIDLLTDFSLKKIENMTPENFYEIVNVLSKEITNTKYNELLSAFFDEIAEGIITTLVNGQDFDFRGLGTFNRRVNARYNTISVKFTPNKNFKDRLQVLQPKNLNEVEKQKVIIKKALKKRLSTLEEEE